MKTFEEKCRGLKELMKHYVQQDVMVAFSGGVDSSLVLKLACEAAAVQGTKVCAVTMQTKLHPVNEMESAARTAKEIGASHIVLPVDELLEAGIADNPKDRCYLCKKHLFWLAKEKAKELKIKTILEGTNEDDLHVYRPGLKALEELHIASPLAESGLTKEDVRRLAKMYGLSVSNRPAMPCLATRFPYGTHLSYEGLGKVELGEEYIRKLGCFNIRLRIHGTIVRIEVDGEDFELILTHLSDITAYLKTLGYTYITLDLEGFRSGSMDVGL